MTATHKPTIVVVGCGFAGYSLVRELRRRHGRAHHIVAFDKQPGLYNYPALPRLLYEELAATDIEIPYQRLFAGLDVDFHQARITAIDTAAQLACTDSSTFAFDYLVVATGSRARPLPQDDGVFVYYPKAMRHLDRLRTYLQTPPAKQQRNLAVIGGGLTGIEFALAMRDAIDPASGRGAAPATRIHLFEQGERLVPRQRHALGRALHLELESAGVEVHLLSEVSRAMRNGLLVRGEALAMDCTVCCIGVQPHLRQGIDGLETGNDGLVVDDALRLGGTGRLFAVGDVMTMRGRKSVSVELHMAQRAMEQGRHTARNIGRLLLGGEAQDYAPTERPVSVLSHAGRGVLAYRDFCIRGRLAGRLKRWLDLKHV
ncbi:MAG: FAD-dependent oxidoreductase [Gammaproteobacteria bacterium]|nr:FAD-dependent oxidoreductase [Gammaproteobacteria bacterium]